ncbi:uncharacterized protein F5147DRAFT_837161 [Suillus discolor]|uniref:Fungal-type protein kinase domain-containing protein n=1 Tax=Suillus discolor TaxID=1912936 RepID=A0A9P7JTV4_9AGAM|nr:uncharacterized protein F5147DRAFT_837161 [Suillus discolor]KAG2107959.1 hypothetical protein F5147DRAFT_837161 [Suillus discolor]
MSPARETGTSSTPPRANASSQGGSKIESTPNSRGASVVSENISLVGVQVKEVRPWIQRDIEQAKQCKADAMLQALLQRASCAPETEQPELLQKCLKGILPVCNGQVFAGGMSSSGIETALKEYVRPGIESDFYSPFIEATNIALACLEEIKIDGMRAPVFTVDMIFQQNDMPMYQTHQTVRSTRKPDVVILPLNSACAPFEDEKGKQKSKQKDDEKGNTKHDEEHDMKRKAHMAKNAKEKPPAPLHWKDVLACIEFKRKTPGRTKEIKAPPSSYTVTDYVPTKPEYLPVDHLKAEVPTPGSSQTPATQPASDNAPVQSSDLTAAQPSKGGSSSKRKAADTLESTAKKFKVNPDEPDVTVQTGLYTAEMFAANLAVEYLINFIVVDDVIWTWYYDRQGTVQSSGINFIQDLPRFIVLLYALQRFKVHDWGRNKDFLPVQVGGKQCHEFTIKDEDLGTVDLLLHTSHDERVTHYGLQGRATNVVPVTSEALTKKYGHFQDGMVAKIFWGEASRTSEPEILKKVEEIAKRHPTVQDHIPELLWHHTFTNPTSAVREALGVPEPSMGSRVLYILVFRKLYPITKLHGKDLFDVWRQCILCHLTLWKEGVYHRDISPGNLMWYRKNRRLIGVLNDYDLSSLANAVGPQGNERTGTVPFMALELLTKDGQQGKVKHLYRHDLESFMWVFAWICLRYRQGVLLPQRLRPLDEWATLDAIACGEKKLAFLVNPLNHLPPDLQTSQSEVDVSLWALLVECFQVLDAAAYNRRNHVRRILLAQLGSTEGTYEQINAEETVSDMDDLLGKFTGTVPWVKLSNTLLL